VHGDAAGQQRALVVVDNSSTTRKYAWKFTHRQVGSADLHVPFEAVKKVASGEPLAISGPGLQALVEPA
jgi:hypothetical protein